MVSVALHVEGGGDSREQKARLRKALRGFLERAGLQGQMPRIVACGSREKAYDKFKIAHTNNGIAMLLVDAEGPVTVSSAWQHLREHDGWPRPARATDYQCHLMVQVMESWFLADREALARFYGTGFRSGSIPQWPNIEQVPKPDIYEKLDNSTRGTTKGGYHKGRHSFEILGRLDPNKVAGASPHAKRLFESLQKLSA